MGYCGEEGGVSGSGAGDFVEGSYCAEWDRSSVGVGGTGVVLDATADDDGGEDVAVAWRGERGGCNGLAEAG